MAAQALNFLQGHDGFVLTLSDTVNVIDDVNNTGDYKFVFVHNRGTSGDVKVTTVQGTDLTVYIAQGDVFPLAVKRVWSTGTTPTTLVGIVGVE